MQDPLSTLPDDPVDSDAWRRHRQELEDAELAAPMCQPTAEVYTRMLLVYLTENELMLAKFLWKRIPEGTKSADPTLSRAWEIGKAMLMRDPAKVHEALKGEWPQQCAKYVDKLKATCRERFLHLVGEAYSSISASDLARFVGLSESEALKVAAAERWTTDAETGMVLPRRRELPPAGPPPSEEKIRQLTDYICFLEK